MFFWKNVIAKVDIVDAEGKPMFSAGKSYAITHVAPGMKFFTVRNDNGLFTDIGDDLIEHFEPEK